MKSSILDDIAKLHPNAIVAWDRDVDRDPPPEACVYLWTLFDLPWTQLGLSRKDGIGAVFCPKLFRAVLHHQPDDPLTVRWWIDPTEVPDEPLPKNDK